MMLGKNPRQTLAFVIVGAFLMILLHVFIDNPAHFSLPASDSLRAVSPVPVVKSPEQIASELDHSFFQYEEIFAIEAMEDSLLAQMEEEDLLAAAEDYEALALWSEKPKPEDRDLPLKVEPVSLPAAPAYAPPRMAKGRPQIAIIIDDMGMDRKHSFEIMRIDAPLTLAFLPYAPGVRGMAQEAKNKGFELMIHMPMQAMGSEVSLGSIALKSGMSAEEIDQQMDAAFSAFDGYKGLNNHMGSRLTQDRAAMAQVMQSLKAQGLYFIDSKTIGSSVALDVARAYGLPSAQRDVFLDHVPSLDFVRSALHDLERVADRHGYAIAIGHPKAMTIEGLREWLPDARSRGYTIVSASALVSRPAGEDVASAKAKPEAPRVVEPYGPPAAFSIMSDQIMAPLTGPMIAPVQSPSRPRE